jgi:dihydroflavonol-4-reductase
MIIVTGSTGHIGNNVVRQLLAHRKDVLVVCRKKVSYLSSLDAMFVEGNCFDREFMSQYFHEGDVLIHLAAFIDIKNNQYERCYETNYLGTKMLYDLACEKHLSQLIYVSSVDCISRKNDKERIKEPLDLFPEDFNQPKKRNNYGYTKTLATKYLRNQREIHKEMKVSIVYPSAVFGIHDYKPSYVGKVIQDTIRGKLEFCIPGGYNFVDVVQIAKAIVTIVEKQKAGDYILGGINVSVKELYQKMNQILAKKKKPISIPLFLVKLMIPFVPYLSKFTLQTLEEAHDYDSSKAIEELNYVIPPFDESLKNTIDFFHNQASLENQKK